VNRSDRKVEEEVTDRYWMFIRVKRILETEIGSTASHCAETSLRKRL
jgi:hypothetical protein